MNPLIAQFNDLIHQADMLTCYQLDQASPEELYAELKADGLPATAEKLKRASQPLGYFNGKKP